MSDPSLPSWSSLMNDDCFVDKYGFKHNKMSEKYRLHYLCQQIKQSITKQPTSLLSEQDWKERIKEWKKTSSVTVKANLINFFKSFN